MEQETNTNERGLPDIIPLCANLQPLNPPDNYQHKVCPFKVPKLILRWNPKLLSLIFFRRKSSVEFKFDL